MDDILKLQIPKSETYFAIPDDLSCLKGMSVLDYLKQNVWLSKPREKECREVFNALLQENLHMSIVAPDFLKKCNVSDFSPHEEALSICFFHKGLLQLFHVLVSSKITAELLLMLEHDKLHFKSINFREWCVISALAERHIFAGPFKCSVVSILMGKVFCETFLSEEISLRPRRWCKLEFDDLQHYKDNGEAFDISAALRKIFNIIDYTHKMPVNSMC